MGPVRGGLILALLPLQASAGVCETFRPGWDGVPVTGFGEAVALLGSPVSLVLLVATVVALRFRSQWGVLGTSLLWAAWVSVIAFLDPTGGARSAGMTEGCVGSPTLFILAVSVLCTAAVLITAPRPAKE